MIQAERDVFLPGEVNLTKTGSVLYEYENEQIVFDFSRQRVRLNKESGFYHTK